MTGSFRSIISVALLLSGWSATASLPSTRSQAKLVETASREPLASSQLGVLAVNCSGDTLAVLECRRKMVPASNVKLLTTGVALERLGGGFRYETRLGYSGSIRDSVLVGDLYIIGGGDPTTGSKSDCAESLQSLFGQWRRIVREAGIKRIDGRVIGDARFFGGHLSKSVNWTLEDIGTYYGAGPRGLNFFENAQNFYVTPGPAEGTRPFIHARYPECPWMTFSNRASTSGPRSANTLFYQSSELTPAGAVSGRFPIDRKGYTLECDNQFGPLTCAWYFYKSMIADGMDVSRGYGDIDSDGRLRIMPDFEGNGLTAAAGTELTLIGGTCSAPLREIIHDTNKYSDNFFAETIMHTLGAVCGDSAEYEDCVTVMADTFASMGIWDANACKLRDGSGLSRNNFVSPAFFVRFLSKMRKSPAFGDYFDSLPVPGERKATLEYSFRKTPEETRSRIHCKTGTMGGIRCYSGYITARDGDPDKMIIFSVLSNNSSSSAWTTSAILEEFIEVLASEN